MLVYERREKKPIKVLVPEAEAKNQALLASDIHYDAKKEEYYKLIDYKKGVEEIAPSKIYQKVFEDNQKFEFDNDIYSQEFFDFIKGILESVKATLKGGVVTEQDAPLLSKVKSLTLQVGKKAILDLLAKSYHNSSIKQMIEVLIEIMKQYETLCYTFLE